MDEGPFLAEDAVRAGLVDDLAYDDQLDAKLKPGAKAVVRLKDDDYAKVSAASVGLGGRSAHRRHQRVAASSTRAAAASTR